MKNKSKKENGRIIWLHPHLLQLLRQTSTSTQSEESLRERGDLFSLCLLMDGGSGRSQLRQQQTYCSMVMFKYLPSLLPPFFPELREQELFLNSAGLV
jgi:hypothetical protein